MVGVPEHLSPSTLAKLEQAPCDDCRFRSKCASEHLACEAFSMFMHSETAARWTAAPRAPTRGRYAAYFGSPPTRRAA